MIARPYVKRAFKLILSCKNDVFYVCEVSGCVPLIHVHVISSEIRSKIVYVHNVAWHVVV